MNGLLGLQQPGLVGLPGYPGVPQLPGYMMPQPVQPQPQQPQTPGQFQQQQHAQGLGPSAFGGADQTDRSMQQYGRGQADMTLGNMARMAGLMSSVAGPMGAFSLAAKLAKNPSPYAGFIGPTPRGRATILAGGTVEQALAADKAHHMANSGAAMANNAIAGGMGNAIGHPGGGHMSGGYGGTGGLGGPGGMGFGN